MRKERTEFLGTDCGGLELDYDADGNLATVTSNGIVVTACWYDSYGRRIAKREGGALTLYLWDGMSVIGTADAEGNLREYYTRGAGIAGDVGSLAAETRLGGGGAATVFLHPDWRGDVVLATDAAGNAVAEYGYSAYGEPHATDAANAYAPRFGFSSRERAASGLVYYGFRYASPELCRWTTPDPIRESGGLNLYAFCGNNPICCVDDNGEIVQFIVGAVLIATTIYSAVSFVLDFGLAKENIDLFSERRNLVYQSNHCENLLEKNLEFEIICEVAKCTKVAVENMPATSFALSPLSGSSRPRASAIPPIYNQKLPGRPGYQRVRGSIRENGTYVAPYY